ncbi:MAG: Ig-like domain-containing protein [Solirubrobacterales bacterium]
MPNTSRSMRTRVLRLAPFLLLVAVSVALPHNATAGVGTPPVVTISGYPPANSTAGTFVFSADEPVLGYECKFGALGSWVACVSPTLVSGLTEGTTYEFRVRATDIDDGLTSDPALYTWTVDLTPPAAPSVVVPTNGTWTNDNTPTISGTSEPDIQVLVFDGGTQIGATSADSSGEWTFTPSSSLDDDTYSIRARTRDAAGNNSAYSTTRTLHIDTVSPAAPTITAPGEGELTNADDLVFAGFTEAHSTVSLVVDGSPFEDAAAGASSSWSSEPATAPIDGAHTVAAYATDRAGNVGPTTSDVNFDLESIAPPPPTIDLPLDDLVQSTSLVEFSGTAEVDGAVKLFRDGTEFAQVSADPSGDWQISENMLDGSFSVTATTTDAHGNESDASSAVDVEIDTTAPTTAITASPLTRTNQTAATFSLQADEANVSFECSFDAEPWSACSDLPARSGLAQGQHTFVARATDALGNVGSPTDEFAWEIDSVSPTTSFTGGPGGFTTLPAVQITFVSSQPGSSFLCRLDSGAWFSCASPFNASNLAHGQHWFEVRAIDPFGNVEAVPERYSWRLGQVAAGPPPGRCYFRGRFIGDPSKLRRVKLANRSRGVKRVSFRSTKKGIAFVAITRGRRVLVKRSVALREGSNALSLKASARRLGRGTRSLVVDTVTEEGGRGTFKSSARVARNGSMKLTGRPRRGEANCKITPGTKRAKTKITSVRRSGNTIVLSITSNELVLASLRVEDPTVSTDGSIVLVRPRRKARTSIQLLPGTGADGGPTVLHLTAFTAGFRQTKLAIPVPPPQ